MEMKRSMNYKLDHINGVRYIYIQIDRERERETISKTYKRHREREEWSRDESKIIIHTHAYIYYIYIGGYGVLGTHFYCLRDKEGPFVKVKDLHKNSPAYKCGIREHDRIIEFGTITAGIYLFR